MTVQDREDGLSTLGRLALTAARQGATVVAAATHEFSVHQKSSHRDLVTDVDAAAERVVIEEIHRVRPDDAILAEESGAHDGVGEVRWFIDPIDGTANFVRGRPDHAVAVAAEIAGRMAVGAIMKPATGEWIACDETGTVHSSAAASGVTRAQALQECLISVGVSITDERRPLTWSILERLLPEVQDFRRTGSTCCDLYAVATGTLDAFIGVDPKMWDIAAGWAIVNAVGGTCARFPIAGGRRVFVAGGAAVVDPIAAIVTNHAEVFSSGPVAFTSAASATRDRPGAVDARGSRARAAGWPQPGRAGRGR